MQRLKNSGGLALGALVQLVGLLIVIVLQWWFSDLLYALGLWPLGALLRIVVWLEAIGGVIGITVMLGVALLNLARPSTLAE